MAMQQPRSPRWVVPTTAQRIWHQFWQDCHKLPTVTWRRWFGTIALGFGLTALLTCALTLYAKSQQTKGMQAWDEQMLRAIADQAPMSFAQAITWESPGSLIGMLPVVVTFVAIAASRSRPLVAATMIAAYVLQFAFAWLGWGLWNRERPDLIAGGIAAPGLHSFPSGHSLVACTIYGLIAFLWIRASRSLFERIVAIAIFGVGVGLIALSRLVLGAHWPTDVFAGLAIGATWVVSLAIALSRAEAASR
jgi:undecaprenyl-diphosphatase